MVIIDNHGFITNKKRRVGILLITMYNNFIVVKKIKMVRGMKIYE